MGGLAGDSGGVEGNEGSGVNDNLEVKMGSTGGGVLLRLNAYQDNKLSIGD